MINKELFFKFFDSNADYIKKALLSFTLNLEVKEERDIETIKRKLEILQAIIIEFQLLKRIQESLIYI